MWWIPGNNHFSMYSYIKASQIQDIIMILFKAYTFQDHFSGPFCNPSKIKLKEKKRTGVVLSHNFKTKYLFKVTFIDALSN